jgi:hypothetical protein
MLVHGKPKFFVQVIGDWYTVLRRLDKFHYILIDQKPDDELDANHFTYNIPISTVADIVEIFNLISGSGLTCCLGMYMHTDSINIDAVGAGEPDICTINFDVLYW